MSKSIKLEKTNMDRVDSVIVDFPTVERHLEGVMKVFLQFNLIIPINKPNINLIAEDDTDDENPKEKKITNKIIDYTLGKKKLTGEKLKIKKL
jgi:hypothetical protein